MRLGVFIISVLELFFSNKLIEIQEPKPLCDIRLYYIKGIGKYLLPG